MAAFYSLAYCRNKNRFNYPLFKNLISTLTIRIVNQKSIIMKPKLYYLLLSLFLWNCRHDCPPPPPPIPMKILVDASHDGGVWWAPQTATFSESQPHQGKSLADYLRLQGFKVDEIHSGQSVTWTLLKNYKKVIRVNGYGAYTPEQLAAYDSLLQSGGSLLFLNEHLKLRPNDALSVRLGLHFTPSDSGVINVFVPHSVTAGVNSIPFIAGSYIPSTNLGSIQVLGSIQNAANGNTPRAVLGIKNHPVSKIVFIGDCNGIQRLPQPFTDNLIKWLFY
jgi:hypothetical protein